MHYVSMDSSETCVKQVDEVLRSKQTRYYDVVIIDGLYRRSLIEVAQGCVSEDGIIICDDAEGYGFHEGFKDSGFSRVDFFGYSPGVVLPHATSIFFRADAFVFLPNHPIPVIAKE
jgi:hypothetical protein